MVGTRATEPPMTHHETVRLARGCSFIVILLITQVHNGLYSNITNYTSFIERAGRTDGACTMPHWQWPPNQLGRARAGGPGPGRASEREGSCVLRAIDSCRCSRPTRRRRVGTHTAIRCRRAVPIAYAPEHSSRRDEKETNQLQPRAPACYSLQALPLGQWAPPRG